MNPSKKERAKGVKIPSWWMEQVRKISDDRKADGESLTTLARLLSEAIDRRPAWGHGEVSRFLDGKVTTAPMAEAFAIVFGIPRVVYYPRSFDEAIAMQQVARRHDAKWITPEQRRRLAAFGHAAVVAEEEAKDQTPGVASRDEGTSRGRRPGRAARRRSTAS